MKLRGYTLFVLIYAGSAMFALSAFAKMSLDNFTIYGKVHSSFDSINVKEGEKHSDFDYSPRLFNRGGTDEGNYQNAIARDSHLGIEWNLKSNKNIEFFAQTEFAASQNIEQMHVFNPDEKQTLLGRNSRVGIRGDWGELSFGFNTDSIYKLSTEEMDLFNDTLADNSGILSFDDVLFKRSLTYKSPTYHGFSLKISSWPSKKINDGYAFVLSFKKAPVTLSFGLEHISNDLLKEINLTPLRMVDWTPYPQWSYIGRLDNLSAWSYYYTPVGYRKYRLGGSLLDFHGFNVSYIYEKRKIIENERLAANSELQPWAWANSNEESHQIQLGYKYKDFMLKAMYGKDARDTRLTKKRSTAAAIGIDYFPSFEILKGSKLYLLYLYKESTNKIDRRHVGRPIIYPSSKWSGISAGVTYNFVL